MPTRTTPAASSEAADHLALVAEMSRDFAESQDVDETLRRGLARIAGTLGAEAASLFLLQDGDLVCRACHGPVDIAGLRLAADSGIVGRAVQTCESQIVRDTREDPDFGGTVDRHTGFSSRSILCAPLSVRNELLGAIELINKQDGALFDATDRRLLEALATAAALALINARLAAEMVEREALRREIALAAAIQRNFLPGERPDSDPVHGINVPARLVSGDFYDIVDLPDGRIWFNVADVSGKGVNAALLMAKTASLFRYLARTADDPVAVLRAVNRELYETAAHGMFVTMACGLYDPRTGTARLASAGHEPALVRARDDHGAGAALWLPASTPPLGILPDLEAGAGEGQADAAEIELRGHRLYLFSDGLTEAPGHDGAPRGHAGLNDLIARIEAEEPAAAARLAAVVARVAPADGTAPGDDLTLLVVEGPPA